eukprot:gene20291-28727_t
MGHANESLRSELEFNNDGDSQTTSLRIILYSLVNNILRFDQPLRNVFRVKCRHLIDHFLFRNFFSFLILVNVVLLGMDHYPSNASFPNIIDVISFLLTLLFAMEMIIALLGLGIIEYFSDNLNCFDFSIVIISLCDLALSPLPLYFTSFDHNQQQNSSSFAVLRAFRLLRLFRVIRSETFKRIFFKIIGVVYQMLDFLFLLGLFVFIMALIGMQFFANHFRFDGNGLVINDINSNAWVNAVDRPSSNFDSFTISVFT